MMNNTVGRNVSHYFSESVFQEAEDDRQKNEKKKKKQNKTKNEINNKI